MNRAKKLDKNQLQAMMQAQQPEKPLRLKIYRLLKVWDAKAEKPGYVYFLQQGIEVKEGEKTKRVWTVNGVGDLEWAKTNAEHYKLEIPTEEYVLEDYQDEDSDPVPEAN